MKSLKKHLLEQYQMMESLFDKDLINKSPSILREISICFFEKMMNATNWLEWNEGLMKLKKFLAETKTDNISFDEYTDRSTYKNGVMTIVPLPDLQIVMICYKINDRCRFFKFRAVPITGKKIFPQYYFWAGGIPSITNLVGDMYGSIKKASKQHGIYKITFTESDLDFFNKTIKTK